MLADPRPDPAVALILLTLDQRSKTLRCLSSLARVEQPPMRVVLWDNGSRDGTAEAVAESFPEVLVQRSAENIGVASGRNAAARLAASAFSPPFLLFLDNDMEVTPGFLSALLAAVAQDDRLAQATAKIAFLGDRSRLYGAGGCYISFWRGLTGHVGYGETDRGQYDAPADCLPSGGCMLVRTAVFEEIGGFDTAFDPYGPEDLDFGLRLRGAGYRALYVPEALVFHENRPGHTFGGGMASPLYAQNKMRLWLRFLARHGSVGQKLGFWLFGAPMGFVRLVIREVGQGNLRAVSGLVSGALDHLRRRRRG